MNNMSLFLYSASVFWRSCKSHLIFLVFIRVIEGFIPVINIFLFERLINEAARFINHSGNLEQVFVYLACQLVTFLLQYILEHLSIINDKYINQKIGLHIKEITFNKMEKLAYIHFENPEFQNKLQMISGIDQRIVNNVTSSSNLLKECITLISILVYLINIHWVLVVILFVGIIPLFIIEIKNGSSKYELMRNLTPVNREMFYISNLLYRRESVKELRLFQITSFLIKKWRQKYEENNLEEINLLKKQTVWLFASEIILVLVYALTSAFLLYLMKLGRVLVGSLVAVLQAIQNIQASLNSLIRSISNIYENLLYVKEFSSFISLPEIDEVEDKEEIHSIQEISVQQLNFTYPNQGRKTLKDVNLKITPGKKIAIIGENGSGKTTLIKCLTGLYDTDSSMIHVNGMPLNKIDLNKYFKKISVLFQDFNRFEFTVRENIGFGNLEDLADTEKLKEVIKRVGLENHIKSLPNQYDSRLGRFFDGGNELSGGQWQKIAIARCLFRECDLIVLDEPTSALDPKSEVEIMEEFFRYSSDKAVIFITHRLGAAWLADEIIVMERGRIAERGTHQELLHLDGIYKELFVSQSKWYMEHKELVKGSF
ncbi:ABC transporter permease [Bacillus toyonensis]|uniref:ABC transporter permease n=2 Tax=Bacillus toyonensis TaxID=155322 RepID=A0A2B5B2Z5_9BACI|nr:ABC transporter permease [Bacillus toyonensis]PEK78897.1 ABC transporter permease [Bacillus toyonensis]PEL30309.1 ABC transporter permease [Bacillus toyonensis]PEO52708.1 ABC transporter permease [Bacillus toyonensis]PFY33186.1 ABC transporter permease [Bacillus toyonensis]